MRDENYITIQGWMRNQLGLKGNSLIVYAVIYGFSQDGKSWFTGSASYLADWCGISPRAISAILADLEKQSLIARGKSEKGSTVPFKAVLPKEETSGGGMKKLHRGYEETSGGGYEETSCNNPIRDIDSDNTSLIPSGSEVSQEQHEKELYHLIMNTFEEKQPGERFTSYPAEGKATKEIIKKVTARTKNQEEQTRFAIGMIKAFAWIRENDRFYGGKPFLPSQLNAYTVWEHVLSAAHERAKKKRVEQEESPFMRELEGIRL
jgi:hypothetical protein